MDSGLGVRWPLSPYATALAAGALFAFCLALWKHRFGTRKRVGKDLKGQRFGKDLDPTKEQDVPDKPGKEKKEADADRFRNFPVLTLRDGRRVFSYEQLCVSGQFGAIPRTQQRRQSLESPNLYSAFRRRNVKKENKNWPEFNPASSYIYQQPFCFGSEIPRLSAKLFLNISPNLNSYFNQAKETTPGVSRKSYFDDFDVSIKPEILKNKPMTRSAVCLALEQQLHKFLDEPFHEVKLIERAIQTTEESGSTASADNTKDRDLNFDPDNYDAVRLRPDSTENEKKTCADSSLWDSGYGEKAFEERSNTPRDYSKDDKIEECSGESSNEPSIISDNLVSCSYLSDNNLVTSDNKTLNNYDVNTCSESTDKFDKSNTVINKLDSENSDVEILYEEIATKTLNTCDMTTCPESEDKPDESNAQKLDSENLNVEIHFKETENSTDEESTKILSVNECLDENLSKSREEIQVASAEENIFRCIDNNTDNNTLLNICDVNTHRKSEDKLYESNTQTNKLNFQASDVDVLSKEIEKSTVEKNTNTSSVKECESLLKCREEARDNFNEENILRHTDNCTDDIKTANICDINTSLKSEDKLDKLKTQINKLSIQNTDVEILYKNIEKSTEENTSTSSVTECLNENLSKCREESRGDSNEENIFRDTDNSTDSIKTVNICDKNKILESEEKSDELNAQINELDFQHSDDEILYKDIEKSAEENTNISSVTECLDENLSKCREEVRNDSNEEIILSDTNNLIDSIQTVNICDINKSLESEDKSDEPNTQINKFDFQNNDVKILYKDTEKSAEENANISSVTECLDKNLLKCREVLGDSNEENILGDTNNLIDSIQTVNICDTDKSLQSEDKSDEPNTQISKFDFQNSDVKILYKDTEKSAEENAKISSAIECLDENLLNSREYMQRDSNGENILTDTDNSTDNIRIVSICDKNKILESEEKSDELNAQINKLDFQNSDVEIPYKDTEKSAEENTNTSSVTEYLDENILKCTEEVRDDFNEENILRDTDNVTDNITTVNISDTDKSLQSEDKSDEPNTQINKLDFQNSDVEILYKGIEKSAEENTNISSVIECLDENLLNCREDMQRDSNRENILTDTDNSTGNIRTVNICDKNKSLESEEKSDELNAQINKLDFKNSDVEILYKETEKSTLEENPNTSSVTEYLDENILKCREEMKGGSNEENILSDTNNFTDDIKVVNICDINASLVSEDKLKESNTQINKLDFQNSHVEILHEKSTIEENTNTSSVTESLDENLLKCREQIQGNFNEENSPRGSDNPTDDIKTINICDITACPEAEDKSDKSNTQRNKLDFQNNDNEIHCKEIESTIEENTNILGVSECLKENLLKFSEETEVGSSEENIVRDPDNQINDCKTINICDINTCPSSEDKPDELNIQTKKFDSENSDVEIIYKDIENSTIEGNSNILNVRECLEETLVKYSEEMQVGFSEENILSVADDPLVIHLDSDRESAVATDALNLTKSEMRQPIESLSFESSDLEEFQNTFSILPEERQKSRDENLFRVLENMAIEEKNLDSPTRVREVDAGHDNNKEGESSIKEEGPDANSDLDGIQNAFDTAEEPNNNNAALSAVLRGAELSRKRNNSRLTETPGSDVTEGGSSRDSAVFDERGTFNVPRQMDRETGERSVAVESTVTTETTFRANGDARLSTAVVSRLTLDDWSACSTGVSQGEEENSVSVQTTVSEDLYRPTFEEFVPLKSGEKISKSEAGEPLLEEAFVRRNGTEEKNFEGVESSPSSPRVDRLKGLLSRDEERRARTKFHHLADGSHVGGAMEGEWDRLLRDVLASVSELERWERRQCDVSGDAEDAEQQQRQQHHFSQSDSSFTMEEEALSPNKGETPTKVKSLRFKLDPDVFDVPSDDSFYDDDDDETRRVWKKQPRYRAFSSLELHDEPVRLVSVHASVVPAGQKMVARPVGIDLRVRLTEERQSKRAHVSTSPSQAKRRSPVSDRGIGWCQELSPVTENVDWRETFTPVTPECKSVPNGILKTPSPKTEPSPIESPNPFKLENGVTTNGVSPVIENKSVEKPKYNGWKPVERKPFLLPRKKFEPDPEAVERITGYKSALSKPPLPPPIPSKLNASLIVRNRAEMARKQYLDSKAALSANKVDGTKKFQQFLNQAQNDRARIITSVPDLAAIERAVTEQWTKERGSVSPRESPGREDNKKNDGVTLSRGSTPDDKWASYVQSCRQHLGRRSQSMTYLETDIDIIPVLDDDDKCHSTSALDEPDEALPDPDDSDLDRSREDLDDSGRAKSEHELRIERSLRSLPIPDWYRRSEKTKTGFLLGSSNKEKRGWAAAKSLASSTSSLASCGLRRPVRSLRSSRENIPWSRSSASPDGPTLSLALAKAFREPYLGWRARTPTSSGVSSSPRASPPSWGATTTDDEANGVSFDGEDAFGRTTSSEEDRRDEPLSLDDTGADAVTVSMDTNDPVKLPGGEDTCDDINNMSMDTCELFDASVVVPVDEDPSPQADTGDDIDNLSTDTTTTEGRKLDPKLKRYSYSQSIYHSEWDEEEESRGDRKGKEEDREPSPSSPDHKVVWIESSFVGSRTTTSIVVLPEKRAPGSTQERPASR